MTAEKLMKRFSMQEHIENGAFVEKHYEHTGEGRAPSGMIYYYVGAEEKTEFHVIDCDEYWCYTAGGTLEIWAVEENGRLSVKLLGIEDGCEPGVYLRRGTVFASKHPFGTKDGTFLTCITVPRFSYGGFKMIPEEKMRAGFPETEAFFSK